MSGALSTPTRITISPTPSMKDVCDFIDFLIHRYTTAHGRFKSQCGLAQINNFHRNMASFIRGSVAYPLSFR